MADRTPSYPGGEMDEGAVAVGWRLGVAAAWRAIEFVPGDAVAECRKRIEALGNAGPDIKSLVWSKHTGPR